MPSSHANVIIVGAYHCSRPGEGVECSSFSLRYLYPLSSSSFLLIHLPSQKNHPKYYLHSSLVLDSMTIPELTTGLRYRLCLVIKDQISPVCFQSQHIQVLHGNSSAGSTLSWGYQSPVVLSYGAQKHINFNIPFYETPAEPRGIVATLSDNKGKVVTTQTATPFILHSDSLLIGILSDYTAESPEFNSLSNVSLPDPERSIELATLNASTMPDVAEVLDNFDVIVLENFPISTLNHAQLNALQTWINRGGSFIVIGGSDWQRTLGSLPPQLLPVNVQGTGMLPPATRVLPIGSPTIAETGQTAASYSLPQSISISTATLPDK